MDHTSPFPANLKHPIRFATFPGQLLAIFALLQIATAEEIPKPTEPFTMEDFSKVAKIDAHAHIQTRDAGFVRLAEGDGFRFINIAVHSNSRIEMEFRHRTTFFQRTEHPKRVAVAVSFPMAGWDDTEWVQRTIAYLDDAIAKGAVAVKVWKNIGMDFRDKDGRLVMIDDPKFDPIFAHLANKGIRVIGHLGEPKNCWLPLESMTVKNDQNYFREHPEYHMFQHPEMPTYEDQMSARDRMVAKNPSLQFIGAHFGSIEWSTDELGKFLDRYPNASVDTAARMGQLQYQSNRDRDKVIEFLTKYQDRIVYGTDLSVAPDSAAEAAHGRAKERWLMDWRYFNTADEFTVPQLDDKVRGLALPRSVVEKIYRLNAERLFANAWGNKG
ncbi:MAG: hypothetical protein ACI9R3_004764 [Verrucomicrobiales bacterium]|jgi:hypothetical protein